MQFLRILCVPLAFLACLAFVSESGCGKCTPGDRSSYPACQVDDSYAHSPRCTSAQICTPFVPGSSSETHCFTSCAHSAGCGPNEYCLPLGAGPACGHIIDPDAGIVDGGSCLTFFACQPNICP